MAPQSPGTVCRAISIISRYPSVTMRPSDGQRFWSTALRATVVP